MRTTSKKIQVVAFASTLTLGAALASACGTAAPDPVIGNGGTTSITSGGASATSGGTTATLSGGASSGGATVATLGGAVGSGGATALGGASSQGGASSGGATSAGGATTAGGSAQGGAASGGANSGGAASGGAASGGAASGGAGDPTLAAKPLDGQMLLGPCRTSTGEQTVCGTAMAGAACPPANQTDPALSGVLTTDKTITLGGDPSKTYTITLHVQGEVETKNYISPDTGDQDTTKSSPMADGFKVGGKPESGNAYNVYMLRVSAPKQDYFLNDISGPGRSDHTTYGMDYTAKITAQGGATIRLVASDSNCNMIRNCGPTGASNCAQPIVISNMDSKAVSLNPSFDFTKPYDGQWIVLVVTAVTES